MKGAKPLPRYLNGRGLLAALFPRSVRGHWKPLSAVAVGALLLCAGQAQAQSCADLYNAIKLEAKDCGFFCDQARLKPLQQAYSASCIHVTIPLSPFDLDSIPQDVALRADNSRIDVEAALSSSRR
jgi:hypothetical protein